jgi:hypothetical protein
MAIQGLTPLQSPSPYQWNPQQQLSAATASSSLGMEGDSIAPVAIGVTACSLLTLGAILAVTYFSTSGDKPVKRTQISQRPLEPTPVSTKEITPPLSHGESHPDTTLPGFIDDSGIYREWNKDGLCGMHAYNTVSYKFFRKIITAKEFKENVPDEGAYVKHLVNFAERNGLDTKRYAARSGGTSITGIGDAEAFIILQPGSLSGLHYVAMVRQEAKGGFHLSDSNCQKRREIYSGTATEAFLEYQRKNNITARVVITFHRRVSTQSPKLITKELLNKGVELGQCNLWIKAYEGCPQGREIIIR